MEGIDIQIVEYDSAVQKKSVELRFKVLREPLGLVYTAEQLEEEREEIHLVALKNNETLGVVVLKKMDNFTLKMRQVAVDSNHQKSGIGKKMVVFSEQYALKNGYNSIVLHARETAKDFYLKLDYYIVGDRFVEVGIPHYEMIKELSTT